MRYAIPNEVRKANGMRIRRKLAEIPADMRKPLDLAEWVDSLESFNRAKFMEEAHYFMDRVYNADPRSYELTLYFLADAMQTYLEANQGFRESGSAILINGKKSPWLKVRDIALESVIRLSRELGLTPASRLPAPSNEVKRVFDLLPFPNTKQDKT